MSGGADTIREAGSALAAAVIAPARHLAAVAGRRRRLAEFAALRRSPVLPPPGEVGPVRPLRRILLSCGDHSGEDHALRLLEVLRRRHPGLEVAGFGGARLAAAGMEVWDPLADLNVMGFREVLRLLPRFWRAVQRFAAELVERPPDAVVLVDYPGLHLHLLRIARRHRVPVLDYIAPQLWAWAPWRVRQFRRADGLLVILPFEEDWYLRRGGRARFVGHPLGDALAGRVAEAPPPEMREERPWVGLLPGSRRKEVRENLPVLLEAARRLRSRRPEVGFVLPHLRADLWPMMDRRIAAARVELVRAPGAWHGVLERLRAAAVVSGTALLEVAAHRVPPVLLYAIPSRLAASLAPRVLAVPWVGSLNLVAGRPLAPEFVGRRPDPERIARALEERLDGPVREEVLAGIESVLPLFALPGAAERAARALEEVAGLSFADQDA